jgi:hypothetical protein
MKTSTRRLLGLAACAAALTTPAVAHAESTVDTLAGWDGTGEIPFFTPIGLTQIGQTVTVPAGESTLSGFTFQLAEVDDPATLVFRPAVYEWDGHSPVAPALWQGGPTSLQRGGGSPGLDCSTPAACVYEAVTFDTGDIPVTPGQQLVLVLTTLHDTSSGFVSWGTVPDATYTQGSSVGSLAPDLAHEFDPAAWGPLPEDLAFRAVFGANRAVARPPFVNALSSAGGSTEGGERVVVRGENFTTDSSVYFGDVPAAGVIVNRFDELVAITPPHEAGGFDVRVVTPRGTSPVVDADAYTFVAPPEPAAVAVTPAVSTQPTPKAKPTAKAKPKKHKRHTHKRRPR